MVCWDLVARATGHHPVNRTHPPGSIDGGNWMDKHSNTAWRRRRAALTAVAAGALVVAGPTAVASTGSGQARASVHNVIGGLKGPRSIAENAGNLVVAETNGRFSLIIREPGHPARLERLGKVRADFGPAVDFGVNGIVWVLTGGGKPGTGAATLYKWLPGSKPQPFVNIAAYQKTDPDPYDLEKNPTDSNPFGLAALDDGSVLVSDAAGNDLLRVSPDKSIETVARIKPRTVRVPKGLPRTIPGEPGEPPIHLPKAGTKMRAEGVATSVTVGDDGAWYVGELRGVPATPRTSEIWRIEPGTTDAVCDPKHPDQGSCTRFADGLTSIVGLGTAPGHAPIYAVELSKKSWLKFELHRPGSAIGALFKVTSGSKQLVSGRLRLPGGVALDGSENAFVAGPVIGRGRVVRISP
jgi:hypothetical protein